MIILRSFSPVNGNQETTSSFSYENTYTKTTILQSKVFQLKTVNCIIAFVKYLTEKNPKIKIFYGKLKYFTEN